MLGLIGIARAKRPGDFERLHILAVNARERGVALATGITSVGWPLTIPFVVGRESNYSEGVDREKSDTG